MAGTFTFEPSQQYLVKVYSKLGDQVGLNVRAFQTTPTSNAVGSLDGADAIVNEFLASYKNILSNSAVFRGITVQEIKMAPTPATLSTLINEVGTGGAGQLPRQVSGIVTLFSTVAGRAGRGRMYLPFPSAAATTNAAGVDVNIPNAAYVAFAQDVGDFFVGQKSVTIGGDVLQFDWILKPSPISPGGPFNYLATALARARFATQRSRGSYGQPNVDPWD